MTPSNTYNTNFSDLNIINDDRLVDSLYLLERERDRL
jgi:hypothetical protein